MPSMHDFGEGTSVGFTYRMQRAAGRVTDSEEIADDVIVGNPKDGSCFAFVIDPGVTGADSKIGRCNGHCCHRLAEVELNNRLHVGRIKQLGVLVINGHGDDERDRSWRIRDMGSAHPHRRKLLQLRFLGDHNEIPRLIVAR